MGAYTKNIAVIKGLQEGFSSDGGALSGLVRAEKYSSRLRVEVSLLNFASLSEGRYVAAVSDGKNAEVIENCLFEGESKVDTSAGFAAVVCYVHGDVRLIASAVCGDFASVALGLKAEIERAENIAAPAKKEQKPVYEDEALAEENYYEYDKTDEGGGTVRARPQEEEDGAEPRQNEEDNRPVENAAEKAGLARGGFYERMKGEIEGLLAAYPPAEELCAAIEGSRWVKISYGEDSFYVFGIIFSGDSPAYICYGIPASDNSAPPESMRGIAAYLPVKSGYGAGFWVIYQDAETGLSVEQPVR